MRANLLLSLSLVLLDGCTSCNFREDEVTLKEMPSQPARFYPVAEPTEIVSMPRSRYHFEYRLLDVTGSTRSAEAGEELKRLGPMLESCYRTDLVCDQSQ